MSVLDKVHASSLIVLPHIQAQLARLSEANCAADVEKTWIRLIKNALCIAGVRRCG